MSWTIIVSLIFIGLLFLVLEVLVIPGTGLVGIAGFGMLVFGIYESYHIYGANAGHITLAASVVLTVLALYFSLKSKTWDRMMLSKNIDGKVNVIDEQNIRLGDEGITSSRLAPMGKALINGSLVEVQSQSGFVDENVEIVVVKVSTNKILVKTKSI